MYPEFTEQVGEEDDEAEVDGESVTSRAVCHPETRGHVCGELGGWMGIYGPNEVSAH